MARLFVSPGAEEDLDRLVDFIAEQDAASAAPVLETILEALEILSRHPLVGRPVDERRHELVISRGAHGYIALYSFDAESDLVTVLAVRHQREAGFEG